MLDVWVGDLNLTVMVLAASFLIVLPGQLLLCFRVKPLWIRLLPAGVFALLAVAALGWKGASVDWSGLVYLILAVYAAFLTVSCGIGWGIWALVRRRKRG